MKIRPSSIPIVLALLLSNPRFAEAKPDYSRGEVVQALAQDPFPSVPAPIARALERRFQENPDIQKVIEKIGEDHFELVRSDIARAFLGNSSSFEKVLPEIRRAFKEEILQYLGNTQVPLRERVSFLTRIQSAGKGFVIQTAYGPSGKWIVFDASQLDPIRQEITKYVSIPGRAPLPDVFARFLSYDLLEKETLVPLSELCKLHPKTSGYADLWTGYLEYLQKQPGSHAKMEPILKVILEERSPSSVVDFMSRIRKRDAELFRRYAPTLISALKPDEKMEFVLRSIAPNLPREEIIHAAGGLETASRDVNTVFSEGREKIRKWTIEQLRAGNLSPAAAYEIAEPFYPNGKTLPEDLHRELVEQSAKKIREYGQSKALVHDADPVGPRLMEYLLEHEPGKSLGMLQKYRNVVFFDEWTHPSPRNGLEESIWRQTGLTYEHHDRMIGFLKQRGGGSRLFYDLDEAFFGRLEKFARENLSAGYRKNIRSSELLDSLRSSEIFEDAGVKTQLKLQKIVQEQWDRLTAFPKTQWDPIKIQLQYIDPDNAETLRRSLQIFSSRKKLTATELNELWGLVNFDLRRVEADPVRLKSALARLRSLIPADPSYDHLRSLLEVQEKIVRSPKQIPSFSELKQGFLGSSSKRQALLKSARTLRTDAENQIVRLQTLENGMIGDGKIMEDAYRTLYSELDLNRYTVLLELAAGEAKDWEELKTIETAFREQVESLQEARRKFLPSKIPGWDSEAEVAKMEELSRFHPYQKFLDHETRRFEETAARRASEIAAMNSVIAICPMQIQRALKTLFKK